MGLGFIDPSVVVGNDVNYPLKLSVMSSILERTQQ